ncbi:MAG: hypothetical protein ABF812_13345, partial [Gluconobacter cerinus]|uniref:hypothetical protein n=1 Tax=Gluconobacter cerinus TaxID=38307 RepID=UPI0039EC7453
AADFDSAMRRFESSHPSQPPKTGKCFSQRVCRVSGQCPSTDLANLNQGCNLEGHTSDINQGLRREKRKICNSAFR